MSETQRGSYPHGTQLEVLKGRNVFTHRCLGSLQMAMSVGSRYPMFRHRPSFGTDYTHSFVDTEGDVHSYEGMRSPTDQGIIRRARQENNIPGLVEGRIRIQEQTGDALLVHAPNPYLRATKENADKHVAAWRENILSTPEIDTSGAVLLYNQRSGATLADCRVDDVHIITVLPQWAGHTIHSATEGFPPAIPLVQVDRLTF